MILTAEDIEPAESQLAQRPDEIVGASLRYPAPETHRDIPPIAVHKLLRRTDDARTVRSILERDGNLSADQALRILLGICDALQSAPYRGELTTERILVDSDGRVRLDVSNYEGDEDSDVDHVWELGVAFCKMVIGKVPSSPGDFKEFDARLSPRLRRIVHRVISPERVTRYPNLAAFVRDLRREERIQFWQAITLLIVLFGVALVLAMHPPK